MFLYFNVSFVSEIEPQDGYLRNLRDRFLACLLESNLKVFTVFLYVFEEPKERGVLACIKACPYIASHPIDQI
jgi:hypothetical protein